MYRIFVNHTVVQPKLQPAGFASRLARMDVLREVVLTRSLQGLSPLVYYSMPTLHPSRKARGKPHCPSFCSRGTCASTLPHDARPFSRALCIGVIWVYVTNPEKARMQSNTHTQRVDSSRPSEHKKFVRTSERDEHSIYTTREHETNDVGVSRSRAFHLSASKGTTVRKYQDSESRNPGAENWRATHRHRLRGHAKNREKIVWLFFLIQVDTKAANDI